MDEIVKACRGKNLFFSTEVEKEVAAADLIFVSVNTPTKVYGLGKGSAADVKWIESCARTIAKVSTTDKIIIEKSTVPSGTAATLKASLTANSPVFPRRPRTPPHPRLTPSLLSKGGRQL